jgi:hypothetical protein
VKEFNFLKFSPYGLDNFDVILKNTFLDAYKIYNFYNRGKLKVHAKNGYKLVNLDADYNFTLLEMGINLVALANELKSPNFLILMPLKVYKGNLSHKGQGTL